MYNKLFTKILDSSIWLQPTPTRIVWLTFIATMDETGFVQFAGVGNVAHRALVTVEEAQAAIACLEGPDPESSDPEHDGRRVERVPGGWMVLNADKHRAMVTKAISREQTRERVRKHRAITMKRTRNAPVTPSEAEAEAEEGSEAGPDPSLRSGSVGAREGDGERVWELFRQRALALRDATLPLTCRTVEFSSVVDFLARYPDSSKQAWLIDAYLTSRHRPIVSSPLSIGQLCKWAPWLEAQATAPAPESPRTTGNRAAHEAYVATLTGVNT